MAHNSKSIIMDTMRELATKGKFDKATVDSITKASELTRGSFYYHFQNKYDVIEQMFVYDVGEFTFQTDEEFFTSMERVLCALVEHRAYYVKVFTIFEFRAYLYRYFEDVVGKWFAPKAGVDFQPDQLRFVTRLIAYGWTAFICKWGGEGFRESPAELIALFRSVQLFPGWHSAKD